MNTTSRRELGVPKLKPVKFVQKSNGIIKGYAVNTFHGMAKDYNEDRVSIIMNITKPNYKGRWPKCSYFGVFDGHGGDFCSNFLKDNLHRYITENSHFPTEPIEALKHGFRKAELEFVRFAESQIPVERSGSCALVILIVDEMCYIANVGDSRAILSSENGSKVFPLSHDHKPDSPTERSRIEKAGGCIYQSIVKTKSGVTIPGPFRINPGKLSVSRAFGDIEGKLERLGGNSKALIAKPEITYFQIRQENHDFIIMGSDGIFDKLENEQISDCFWERLENKRKSGFEFVGEATSQVLTSAMNKMSMDNLTSLIIVFEDHGRFDFARKKTERAHSSKPMNENISNILNSQIENAEKPHSNLLGRDLKSERRAGSGAKVGAMKRKSSVNMLMKGCNAEKQKWQKQQNKQQKQKQEKQEKQKQKQKRKANPMNCQSSKNMKKNNSSSFKALQHRAEEKNSLISKLMRPGILGYQSGAYSRNAPLEKLR